MAIDPTVDPYALLGRVVTMGRDPSDDVIDDGVIYIRAGTIAGVRRESDPPPPGFESAVEVRTGGTIYPGMIELHNHLSYNAIPLWQVPRAYLHSGHWQGTDEYKVNVTKPAMVLANTAGVAEALVRYAECRCLLGGVTTSQGITLQANGGVRSLYQGLVRNVESPGVDGLPAAKPRIGAPDKDLDTYLQKLMDAPVCYLQHLSEGINDGVHDTALKQFTGLQREDGTWALFRSLCGVHSTALGPEHFRILAENGGSIVWSPLSNYLLYGETTDVKSAKGAGVRIALGSDWAPSGTKNLLGELKVAAIVSDHLGGLFTPRELCEMVTSTPAAILGWDGRLGRIETGALADLIVVDDTDGDPFGKLVDARETSLTLVVIDGIPRLGQPRLMNRFGAVGGERIRVGQSKRILDLTTRPGEVDLGVSLAGAIGLLDDTLRALPERAADLDNALAVGWTPGVRLSALGVSEAMMPPGWSEPEYRVVLEFEEEAGEQAFLEALRAGDLADWVVPMELEGLTVADDSKFLKSLVSASNLPLFVKESLPARHGVRLSVPDLASEVPNAEAVVSPETSRTLEAFLKELPASSAIDRKTIIRQAILLLERYYVHLPMKRTMHAVDPVQRLRNLENELEQTGRTPLSDLEFHRELTRIFDTLRDLHTCYRLPRPFRGMVAWLPFLIEEYEGNRFLVSKLVGRSARESFGPGVEVLYWNGIPIDRYVEVLARETPGGNAAARRARALNSLTLRSLARGQVPDEDWVTITYRGADNRHHEYRQPWLLFEPRPGGRNLSPENLGVVEASGLGLDDQTDDVQQAKKALFAAAAIRREQRLDAGETIEADGGDEVESLLPTIFRARRVPAPDGEAYGYLRIFSFNVDDADRFVDEFSRLLGELPPSGLIVDIRGNGGGLIHAAECSLELLSPIPIEPEPVQFINTPATLRLSSEHRSSARLPGLRLEPWLESMTRSVASGATHSLGIPLTRPDDCNRRGQRYQGPKVLVVDGLCYSAADMFAAGFQDHGIGPIVGLHPSTGAGGANVWSHRLLQFLTAGEDDHGGFRTLPGGADLRVAVRRTLRVGSNAGELVEDFGVEPDMTYTMTRRDVLEGNADLIQRLISVLREQPAFRVRASAGNRGLEIRCPGAEWVQFTTAGRPVGTVDCDAAGCATLTLPLPHMGVRELEIVAYADSRPVARTRHTLAAD